MAGSSPWRVRLAQAGRAVGSLPFRIVVTLALIGVVAAQIDWSRMGHRLSHGQPLYFLAAVAAVLVALIAGAVRWERLLAPAGLHLGAGPLARIYAVSTFSNTFLPTTVGGDVTRALLVARRGPLLARTVLTIVVDRAAGLAGLLGLGWLALAIEPARVPHGARSFLAWVTLAVLIGGAVTLILVFRGNPLGRAIVPDRHRDGARASRSLLQSYATDPVNIVVVLLLSLAHQALISLQLVLLAHAIDVNLSFATAAVVLALVTVVTLIPISIGGFGIREGTYVVLLAGASIAATDAALISILSVASLFIASLPGAALLMRGGVAPALEVAPG